MDWAENVVGIDKDSLVREIISRKPDNLIANVAGMYVSEDYIRTIVRDELKKLLEELNMMDEEKR